MSLKDWLQKESPFGNALWIQIILYVFVTIILVSLFFWSKKAHGAELDFMGGSTIVRGQTGALEMNVRWPGAIGGYADLSAGMALIGESFTCPGETPQCNNGNQAVVHAQVGILVPHTKLELALGIAHLQHEDSYNSGNINFSLSMQHPIWSRWNPNLFWRYQHFSNAGTNAPNLGRDMLFVGWRFK